VVPVLRRLTDDIPFAVHTALLLGQLLKAVLGGQTRLSYTIVIDG
jgi:hypothetical protein